MRALVFLLLVPSLAFCLVACGAAEQGGTPEVVVFAAASLRDVVGELAHAFESQQEVAVVANFAGSNTLAQQIDAAPGADVFLSADEKWVDFLARSGRLVAGSQCRLLSNRLVLIAHRDAAVDVASPAALMTASYRLLALADPEAVPAGRYARAYLEQQTVGGESLWPRLANRVVPALDVRAALALVESDPDILGIVYETDALTSEQVRVVYAFPPIEEVPITYWGVLVAGGDAPQWGARLLDFLQGPEAAAIIGRHGFVPVA